MASYCFVVPVFRSTVNLPLEVFQGGCARVWPATFENGLRVKHALTAVAALAALHRRDYVAMFLLRWFFPLHAITRRHSA
ncbi:hypothetical protein [Shinella sp.]|uniref:hypothetical protein n=1 Tax=Shinella sp. TaxID=1870904 RepID=UPI00289C036E|nr:hypothetical protein [Shinella sp.]